MENEIIETNEKNETNEINLVPKNKKLNNLSEEEGIHSANNNEKLKENFKDNNFNFTEKDTLPNLQPQAKLSQNAQKLKNLEDKMINIEVYYKYTFLSIL